MAAKKKPTTKSNPRSNPRSQANRSPRSAPAKKTKTADEVRALMRAKISKTGAYALAELSSDGITSHVGDWLSTRSLELDALLGCPGAPMGRMVMACGKPHSGKTTLAAMFCAEAQARGGIAYYRDKEEALDLTYMWKLGVDVDRLEMIIPTGKSFEDDIEAIEEVIDHVSVFDLPVVIVYDSIGQAASKKDLKRKFGDRQPGAMAQCIRDMARRIVPKLAGTRILFVVINHTYKNIMQMFGSPEVAYGGDGLWFACSVILHFKKRAVLPDGVQGQLSKVTVWKSKVAPVTGQSREVALARGLGFDNVYAIYTCLEERKLIQHNSGWCAVTIDDKPVKWQGGWPGLYAKLSQEPTLFARFADAFRALQPRGVQARPIEVEPSPEGEVEVAAEAGVE